ncbi:tetratricopeptide repeat protein [Streptomyces sp. NPDC020983]|uniref:tetratricopeptide repeat protein n=1 Tax=Streptomyces sp. NPDC020983 TaxID=3365106 RepID=UPI0037A16DD6
MPEVVGVADGVTGGRGRGLRRGVSAGRDVEVRAAGGGFAVGAAEHVTLYAAPRQPAALPHQVGVVPALAQSFQARPESAELRAEGPCHVLTGLGGVGKTQLAAAHAHRAWDAREVDVLVWVTATGRPAVVASYAQAAAELCGADPAEPEQAAAAFLAWLRAKPHRWLVVLDDVADPADLRGLWPPDSPTGRTLVTTRRRDAALTGTGRRRVDVGLFTPEEATGYLAGVLAAHGRSEPAAELADLAEELGRLPLALSQAAAYLADQALTAAAYRALLADRTRTLAHALPGPEALPDDQRLPVAAAWSLSAELADASEPRGLARPLLALTAVLDPNGIPAAVLTAPAARAFLARKGRGRPRWGRRRRVTVEQVHETLRVLHRLSLVDHTPERPERAVHVHALVQRTTRETLTPKRFAASLRATADALTEAWPENERDIALAAALRANAAALIALGEPTGCLYERSGAHIVLFRYGMSLEDALPAAEAAEFYRALTEATTRHLGRDHWCTLVARQLAAQARGRAGDAAGAAKAYEELLKDRLRVLGRNDYSTLATRLDLAEWRGESGDGEGAVAAYTELLDDTRRVHGPDHHNTLSARFGLARWRGESGDPEGAVAAFTGLLPDVVRVFGPDDRRTLGLRHTLARWRGKAGDPEGAVAACTELLPDVQRVLGPDHRNAFILREDLAGSLGRAGDTEAALAAYAALVDDMTRVLGTDHPDTRAVLAKAAAWREAQAPG